MGFPSTSRLMTLDDLELL